MTSISGENMGIENQDVVPPYPAGAVAKSFVNLGVPQLGVVKLLKLVYIAHGWHLGLYGKSLIREEIETWKKGPVIRELYNVIKTVGRKTTPGANSQYEDTLMEFLKNYSDIEDSNARKVIEEVSKRYGNETGDSLTELTHKRGSPWDITLDIGEIVISNELIADYYSNGLTSIGEKKNERITT